MRDRTKNETGAPLRARAHRRVVACASVWSLATVAALAGGCGEAGPADTTGTTSTTGVFPGTSGSATTGSTSVSTGSTSTTTGVVSTTGTSSTTTGVTGGSTTSTTGFVPVTTGGNTGGSSGGIIGGLLDGGLTGFGSTGFGSTGFGSTGFGSTGGSTTGGTTGAGTTGGTTGHEGEGPDPALLPKADGSCPDMSSGSVTVAGSGVRLWAGDKPGPVYFYFHGTGSSASEVDRGLPGATRGVSQNGGFVASFSSSNGQGRNTGNGVWYTGDFDAADQLVACGIEAGIVDTSRIYASGYSAGGLQSGGMAFARSNYIAAVVVYSGGNGVRGGGLADPNNAPSILGAHGAAGSDVLILDFAEGTRAVEQELKSLGAATAIDCDDGGGHVAFSRLGVDGAAMQFLADHPFGVEDPYGGSLPSSYPSHCELVQ